MRTIIIYLLLPIFLLISSPANSMMMDDVTVIVSNACESNGLGTIDVMIDPSIAGPFDIQYIHTNGPVWHGIVYEAFHIPADSDRLDLQGASLGSYSIQIFDSDCRMVLISNIEVTFSDLEIKEPNNIKPTDCGEDNGRIRYFGSMATGGSEPYSFMWSNGSTSNILNNLAAGIYTLTVTDNEGCTREKSFSVMNANSPSMVQLNAKPSCPNIPNGEIIALFENPNSSNPLNFEWNVPGGVHCAKYGSTGTYLCKNNNVYPGLYSVTVTDPLTNCSTVYSLPIEVINQESPLTIDDSNLTLVNNCDALSIGSISNLSISGGFPDPNSGDYEISWSTGDSELDIFNLSEGEFTLTVVDYCGNVVERSFTIDGSNTICEQISVNQYTCQENKLEIIHDQNFQGVITWPNGKKLHLANGVVFGDLEYSIDSPGEYCVFIEPVGSESFESCFTFIPEQTIHLKMDSETFVPLDTPPPFTSFSNWSQPQLWVEVNGQIGNTEYVYEWKRKRCNWDDTEYLNENIYLINPEITYWCIEYTVNVYHPDFPDCAKSKTIILSDEYPSCNTPNWDENYVYYCGLDHTFSIDLNPGDGCLYPYDEAKNIQFIWPDGEISIVNNATSQIIGRQSWSPPSYATYKFQIIHEEEGFPLYENITYANFRPENYQFHASNIIDGNYPPLQGYGELYFGCFTSVDCNKKKKFFYYQHKPSNSLSPCNSGQLNLGCSMEPFDVPNDVVYSAVEGPGDCVYCIYYSGLPIAGSYPYVALSCPNYPDWEVGIECDFGECPAGMYCNEHGICQPACYPYCEEWEYCDNEEIPENGDCVEGNECDEIICPEGMICFEGECIETNLCEDCEEHEICVNGKCENNPNYCYPPCVPGQICENNECIGCPDVWIDIAYTNNNDCFIDFKVYTTESFLGQVIIYRDNEEIHNATENISEFFGPTEFSYKVPSTTDSLNKLIYTYKIEVINVEEPNCPITKRSRPGTWCKSYFQDDGCTKSLTGGGGTGTGTVWTNINFSNPQSFIPHIFGGVPSNHNTEVAMVETKGFTTEGFQAGVSNWKGEGMEQGEDFSYFATGDGEKSYGEIQGEVGVVDAVTRQKVYVPFAQTYSVVPVVFVNRIGQSSANPSTPRISNVTKFGFELYLQGSKADQISALEEDVSFMALTPGSGTINGKLAYVGTTGQVVGDKDYVMEFPINLSKEPIFIASIQSESDSDPALIKYTSISQNSIAMFLQEENHLGSGVGHAAENIGYLILEPFDDCVDDPDPVVDDTSIEFRNNVAKNLAVKVYPNPFKKVFFLDVETESNTFMVEVYSTTGVKLYSQKHSKGVSNIEMGDFSSGMYLLKILGENIEYSTRIIQH